MEKPQEFIEGTFRVVGEAPKKEPFWGPNAGIVNTLGALFSGCTMMAYKEECGDWPRHGRWRTCLVFIAIIVFIAAFRASQSP